MSETQSGKFVAGVSVRQAAVIAGFAYLFNPVTFAQGYAMPRLFVPDPVQTVANLTAHPHLFSAAVLSYFFSLVGDIVLAWALYILLAPVNCALSLLGSLLQLVYAAVTFAAVSNLGLLYRLVAVPKYSTHITASEVSVQATLLLGAFNTGWGLGLILFGLHLVVIGWLIAHSTYLPRWLGWLLFLTGWAWVADSLSVYLYPNTSLGFLNAVFALELVFMVFLLGWGWRLKDPEAASQH